MTSLTRSSPTWKATTSFVETGLPEQSSESQPIWSPGPASRLPFLGPVPVIAGETATQMASRAKLLHPVPAIGPNHTLRDRARTHLLPETQPARAPRSGRHRSDYCHTRASQHFAALHSSYLLKLVC